MTKLQKVRLTGEVLCPPEHSISTKCRSETTKGRYNLEDRSVDGLIL